MKFSISGKLIIGSMMVLSHFMPHSSYTQHFTREILTKWLQFGQSRVPLYSGWPKIFATIVYGLKLRNSVRTTAKHMSAHIGTE